MNIVFLIIIYAAVCISMIFFNIGSLAFHLNFNDMDAKKYSYMKEMVKKQLTNISANGKIDDTHLKLLRKKLLKPSKLVIFDRVLENLIKKEKKNILKYIDFIKPMIINLIYNYLKRDTLELSCYLNFLEKYSLLQDSKNKEINHILNNLLIIDSSYCRNSSYLLICKTKNPNNIISALSTISSNDKFYHEDIMLNGLKLFVGKSKELNRQLIEHFYKFNRNIKISIIKFLSEYGEKYNEFICEVLFKENDKHIKVECIKHFKNNIFDDFLIDLDRLIQLNWSDKEFLLACIDTLKNYNQKQSYELLDMLSNHDDEYINIKSKRAINFLALNNKEMMVK